MPATEHIESKAIMDYRLVVELAAGAVIAIIAFFLRRSFNQMDETRANIESMRTYCNELSLQLVAEYVKKDDMHRQLADFRGDLKSLSDAIFRKLDKIQDENKESFNRLSDKIEHKADKE